MRSLVALALVAAACSHPVEVSVFGAQPGHAIATGTLGGGEVQWCTSYGTRPYNSQMGFDSQGDPVGCNQKARVKGFTVTTDDPSVIELQGTHTEFLPGNATFGFKALAAGKAMLHLDVEFDPEGPFHDDVEVTIADAVSATRICKLGTTQGMAKCDGTDPAVMSGSVFDVGYQNLRDAAGAPLDGTVDLVATGAVAWVSAGTYEFGVTTKGTGTVTVKTRDPALESLFPPFTVEVR